MTHNNDTIHSTLTEERRFAPPADFATRAHLRDPAAAQALRDAAEVFRVPGPVPA